MTKIYNYQIKETGDISELKITQNPIAYGFERKHTPERRANRENANEQNAKRARRAVHDIVNTNFTEYTKMITLTYAKTNLDYEILSKDYKLFLRYLKRQGITFPYLSITEHQNKRGLKENNAGSLHLHILAFTTAYLPFKTLKDAWGKRGSVHIEKIDKAKNKGAYVAKYISKETMPPDKKSYRTSRNIKKPSITKGIGIKSNLVETILGDANIIKQYDYTMYELTNQETGEITVGNKADIAIYETKGISKL